MEEALIAKLLASPEVTALAGNRIQPGSRPQGSALPAVVLTVVSMTPSYSDDGEDRIAEARVQLDCWGESYASAKTLSRAVKAALSAFDGTVAGVRFRYIALDLEHDLTEAGSGAADYPVRTSLDFLVTFDS